MKTVIPFMLSAPIIEEEVADMQQRFPHADPLSQQPSSIGIVSVETFDRHVHKLIVKITKRVVPSSVVKRLVAEKAAAWAEQVGHQPGRKTLREFKEQAIEELLPKAFLSDTLHTVYLVNDLALLSSNAIVPFIVNAIGSATEDSVTGESVDLSIIKTDVFNRLTEWTVDEPPEPFELGDRVRATSHDTTVSIQSPSILSEFPKVANTERRVSELKLLSENVSFILKDTFVLKSVKIDPEFREGDLLTARLLARTVHTLIEALK